MITCKEIKQYYRSFESRKEANSVIRNREIMKRPGVFLDDSKEWYTIIETTDNSVVFENDKGERIFYEFENILLDYLFTDGEVIGIKR